MAPTAQPATQPEATSIWDDPTVKPASNQFVSFTKPGDKISAVVASVGKHTWQSGESCVQVTFEDDEPTLTAGQVVLAQQLFELRPAPGETLEVELTGIQSRPGGKTLKMFSSKVTGTDGTVRTAGTQEPPF